MHSFTNRSKFLTPVATVGLAAMALSACGTGDGGSTNSDDCSPVVEDLTTVDTGTLSVGVPENMPFTQTEGQGASGMEIQILESVADELCLDLDYTPITYGNGIPMITEQQSVDLITGGWYVTEERAAQVGFTTPTYFDAMGIVSEEGVTTVEELEEIGAVGSGAGFSWEEDMSAILGQDMQNYPGTTEMRQDLLSGRIEAALDGYAVAVYNYADTDYQVEVSEEDERVAITGEMPVAAFPIDPDNEALSDAISDLIDDYRADGTLETILEDYELSTDLLVPQDRADDSLR